MYAIIETGGKQFRVEEGCTLKVAKLDSAVGTELSIDKVLMLGGGDVKIGAPYLEQASVKATVLEHGRGEKIIVFKRRKRHDSRKTQGHRQDYTAIKINAIQA